eukprot:gene31499-6687_t
MCPGPARLTGALKTKTGQKIHLDPEWLNGAMGKPERKLLSEAVVGGHRPQPKSSPSTEVIGIKRPNGITESMPHCNKALMPIASNTCEVTGLACPVTVITVLAVRDIGVTVLAVPVTHLLTHAEPRSSDLDAFLHQTPSIPSPADLLSPAEPCNLDARLHQTPSMRVRSRLQGSLSIMSDRAALRGSTSQCQQNSRRDSGTYSDASIGSGGAASWWSIGGARPPPCPTRVSASFAQLLMMPKPLKLPISRGSSPALRPPSHPRASSVDPRCNAPQHHTRGLRCADAGPPSQSRASSVDSRCNAPQHRTRGLRSACTTSACFEIGLGLAWQQAKPK